MITFFIAVIGIGWALSYAMGNPGATQPGAAETDVG